MPRPTSFLSPRVYNGEMGKATIAGWYILFQTVFLMTAWDLPRLEGSEAGEGVFRSMRKRMVETQLRNRDIRDPGVLEVMGRVPRHEFVPSFLRILAYEDYPLSIGHDQTISQPYIVAFMTQALDLKPEDRVLEIGTGSGYQAAVLGELVREVYSIEIVEALALASEKLLKNMGYQNVTVKHGNGYQGWPSKAPFDAIMVTAAPEEVPQELIRQLKNPGGKMIVPVGIAYQELLLITKTENGTEEKPLLPVRFVPMVTAEKKER